MATKRIEPRYANLSVQSMQQSIPKIQRRIDDLEKFDVSTIEKRWDPKVEALVGKINGTLQEVLGHGTVEYNDYNIHSLDTLPLIVGGGHDPLPKVIAGYAEGIKRASLKLTTLRELFEERIADAVGVPQTATIAAKKSRSSGDAECVFIVHGHDDGAKETIARFIGDIGLKPIILHEQPNEGRTIIEKFEHHADVDYAIVILSPDDRAASTREPDNYELRARQNVVLELGYFLGKIGRNRVSCLHLGSVALPSDYDGVVYIPMDREGAWRLRLAKEMKTAGLSVDLNRAM